MAKKLLPILRRIIAMSLITFIVSEASLRVYSHINPSFIFYSTSYNRARGKPFAPDYDFNLNSRGFKDKEFKPEKETGVYRILGIGDSFAYGVVPYQYNYLTLLEENLNRSRRAEVINMGIAGIGPKDYLALLVDEGLQLKPDALIVSFFIGNDFVSEPPRRLYTYSYTLSLLKYLFDLRTRYEGQVIHSRHPYDDNANTFEAEAYLKLEQQRSEIYRKQNPQFANDLGVSVSYLSKIKEICDQHKIQLAVLIIPDEVQVNDALRQRVVRAFSSGADEFDFKLPNRLLGEALKTHGIAYLDLLADFRSAAASQNLYKPQDTHWNIAGNRLAAEALTRYLLTL